MRKAYVLALIVGVGAVLGSFGVNRWNASSVSSSAVDTLMVEHASAFSETLLADGRSLVIGRLPYASAQIISADHRTVEQQVTMPRARQFHTATALADGRILIWGGLDTHGQVIADGEWFDPKDREFSDVQEPQLTPRAGHTGTTLTDGRVLFAGGWNSAGLLKTAELFDPATGVVKTVTAPAAVGRKASLLADGRVAFQGGNDASGAPLAEDALFDPRRDRFDSISHGELLALLRPLLLATTQVVESFPGPDTKDAPIDRPLSARFSAPMDVRTLNAKTLTLIGPQGNVDVQIHPAEDGRLAFIKPDADLLPGSVYALYIQGARAGGGDKMPLQVIGFDTEVLHAKSSAEPSEALLRSAPLTMLTTGAVGTAPTQVSVSTQSGVGAISDGIWHPGKNGEYGHWRVGRQLPPQPAFTALHRTLPSNATALYGQILQVDDQPIANVQVSLGAQTAQTDAQGMFLLLDPPAGRQELFVDGSKVGYGAYEYGQIVLGVDVLGGKINRLPQQVFLPKIGPQDRIPIDSPTTHEMVLTHPELPGLEIHVPAGTVFRDHKGRIVRSLALVPTPLDRAPYPVQWGFPMYFTLQPGGASILGLTPEAAQGVRVIYPNTLHAAPGKQTSFWVYDPQAGWKSYGKGRISRDGRQVVPDHGVNLYAELGAGYCLGQCGGPPPPANGPPPGCGCGGSGSSAGGGFGQGGPASSADPVDLSTGLFVLNRTDLFVDDVIPISVGRIYRPGDTTSRAFGYGASLNYGLYLYLHNSNSDTPELVLPNGSAIVFNRTSGSGQTGSWTHTATPSEFYGATLYSSGTTPEAYIVLLKDGTQYLFAPDGYNKLTAMRDRFGNTLNFSYGTSPYPVKVTSPSGRFLSFTYDGSNRITQVSDHTGRSVGYSYNGQGALDTVTYPDGTTEKYTYDGNNNMLTVQDRNGNVVTTNQYDGNGRVKQQVLADGATYQFSYFAASVGAAAQTNVTDPAGIVRQVLFDANGYPTSDTYGYGQADAQTYSFQRGATSELISAKTDPLGRVTQYSYDSKGNIVERIDLAGSSNAETYVFTYTPDYNQVASVTDALGHTTSNSYTNGCMTQVKDALGNITAYTCNSSGQSTSMTDPLGHATQYVYSGYDLLSVTDPLGRTTTYYRDGLGRVVSEIDPLGDTKLTGYDVNDRVQSTTDATGFTTLYGHDGNGNLLSVTDPVGGLISFSYDTRNRVVARTDALLNGESWTYDGLGNWLTDTDRNGQKTAASYDDLRRLQTIGYADGTNIQFSSDAGNRVISIADSVSGTISRSYDGFNNLTQEQTPLGTVSYNYDLANRRVSMQVAGQSTASYGYDASDRLTSITAGGEAVAYAYDISSRLTTLTLPNGVQTAYAYDNADELTGLSYLSATGSALGALVYGYDGAGRRISQTGSWSSNQLPSVTTSPYQYNAGNRTTSGNGYSPVFDNDGQLLQDGQGNAYGWNARHQLIQITNGPLVVASFQYDGLGRRIGKTIGGAAIGFLYDGQNPVQEQQPSVINNLLAGLGIDQRYARSDTPGRLYYLTDATNSTIALTDSNGNVQQQYAYDPFGNYVLEGTSTRLSNPYAYTGREDDATGLYYYRARYYSPTMQRFISEDPIGLNGGLNVYAYVEANPLNKTDPQGLKDFVDKCVGRYSMCAASQDPKGSTIGNYLRFRGCKASVDWAVRKSDIEGRAIACQADYHQCTGGINFGDPDVDPNDPTIRQCNAQYLKCVSGTK